MCHIYTSKEVQDLINSFLSFYRTDQLVEMAGVFAKCLEGQPIPPQTRMMINKISSHVSEDEVRDLFKSDGRIAESEDEEVRQLREGFISSSSDS